ncbi:Uncharacterised protein [Mycobacteroides abscessus subsp. abscessus]|nr:Uncharacterised protein [Mycobacteroides abscessus subsp. abscessus]
MVSFFTRRPMIRADAVAGAISPRISMRISDSISSWKISRCSMQRTSASLGVMGNTVSLGIRCAWVASVI